MKLGRRAFIAAAAGTAVLSAENVTGKSTVAQTGESWQSPGYNSRNTGHAAQNTGPVSNSEVAWTLTAESENMALSVSDTSVVDDGVVYVPLYSRTNESNKHYLSAISLHDGSIQWRTGNDQLDGSTIETCYVGESGVYALITTNNQTNDGTSDEFVRYSKVDGTREWKTQLPGKVHPHEVGQVVVNDDTVFMLTSPSDSDESNPMIVAVGTDDGSQRWSHSIDHSDQFAGVTAGGIAATNENIYLTFYGYEQQINETESTGSIEGVLTVSKLSSSNGTRQWETTEQIVTFIDQLTEYGDKDPQLAVSHTVIERFVLPPIINDGIIYTGANKSENDKTTDDERVQQGQIMAIETETGTVTWTETYSNKINSPPAVTDDRLYVVIDRGTESELRAVSLSDQQSVWTVSIPALINSQPTVASETVYVKNLGDAIIAFSAADGTERWRQENEGAGAGATTSQLSLLSGPPVVDGSIVRLDERNRLQVLTEDGRSPVSSNSSQNSNTNQTVTASPNDAAKPANNDSDDSSGSSGPGFGITSTITGAGIAGYLLREWLLSGSEQ